MIRGLTILLDSTWDEIYDDLYYVGKEMCDMPSSNEVWDEYLRTRGWNRSACPNCRSVIEFCRNHPYGRYLLATGSHVIAVINGDYYDIGDSGSEIPIYYYYRKE